MSRWTPQTVLSVIAGSSVLAAILGLVLIACIHDGSVTMTVVQTLQNVLTYSIAPGAVLVMHGITQRSNGNSNGSAQPVAAPVDASSQAGT